MRYREIKEVTDKQKKDRVIRALSKKRADDPLFDKTYKLIVGPQIGTRIENYIKAHEDPDIGAEEIAYLVKTIPDLGTTNEVKDFVEKWNAGEEFININALIPAGGMQGPAPLLDAVQDGIPEKLFVNLTRQNFSKSDAGPAEAALAIMSQKIRYVGENEGGDLIINGKKIEIKGGGKSLSSGGGRIYNDRHKLDITPMTQALAGTPYEGKSVSVVAASQEGGMPADFPTEEFAKAVNQAWFNGKRPEIESTFGTPKFRMAWNIANFDDYKAAAGHDGILIIGVSQYQYIISGEQLHDFVKQTAKGTLYSTKSRQQRELGIQVSTG